MKVFSQKTNTWLFRINTWLFFSVFVFSSLVSWSRFITWYSLYKSDYVNRAYLSQMTYQALPYLVELNVHPEKFSQKDLNETYVDEDDDFLRTADLISSRSWGHQDQFAVRIYRRVYMQLSQYKDEDWRSRTLNEGRVQDELLACPEYGKDKILHLEYSEIKNIFYYPGFSKVERFNAGNNEITAIGELGLYPHLQEADLSGNQITSLNGIEKCKGLTYLNLEGNPIEDYSPLLKLDSLKILNVNDPSDPKLNALKVAKTDLRVE